MGQVGHFWISLGYEEFLLLVHGKGIYWIGIVRKLGSSFVVCFLLSRWLGCLESGGITILVWDMDLQDWHEKFGFLLC